MGNATGAPRQTLAMRLAERNRQRALRAERLARLRPDAVGEIAPEAAPDPAPEDLAPEDLAPEPSDAAEAALEAFLRALTGDRPAPPSPRPEPAAVLSFQRPEPRPGPAPGDLDRLPGAGPGLIWALERAGLRRLADLAPLAPAELAARLGPLGRLVPAQAWIDAARAAG